MLNYPDGACKDRMPEQTCKSVKEKGMCGKLCGTMECGGLCKKTCDLCGKLHAIL